LAPASSDIRNVEDEVARELTRLHVESYGVGAGVARAHVLDDLVICVLDDIELLPNERFMIEAGRERDVLEIRSRYQDAIETAFRAAVERATGRRVISFASQTRLDPNYAIEIFRLAPRQEGDEAQG
jgi:uncharacterized protein YbcI